MKICQNVAVTVERDDQPTPSITPATGSDRREVASQPQGGFIDLSRKETTTVTDTPAEIAKSKPATIREFEKALQTLGFSQRESKAVASNGFKSLYPVESIDEQITALAESLAKYKTIFES